MKIVLEKAVQKIYLVQIALLFHIIKKMVNLVEEYVQIHLQ